MSTVLLPQAGGQLLANGFEKSTTKAVSVWNTNDVSKWLGEIGVPQYKTLFLQNDIDGQALLGLTKKELQEDLGIASFGHRKLLLLKIEELKDKDQKSKHETVTLQRKIGTGASSSVYYGCWRGQECAVKVVNVAEVRPEVLRRVCDEIEIIKSLNHENIVTYYGHEEKDNELRIYMEFMPQSLHQLIAQRRKEVRPFQAAEIKKLASDVARGLDHLHSLPRPIIHRDVKSKNVLVDCRPGYILVAKLCDFGVSIVVSDEKQMADTRIGTVRFMAPEVINGAYNKQADIWSYGMLLYEIMALQVPYIQENANEEIYRKILQGILPPLPEGLDEAQLQTTILLMRRCLLPNPESRPTASEILELLTSPTSAATLMTSADGRSNVGLLAGQAAGVTKEKVLAPAAAAPSGNATSLLATPSSATPVSALSNASSHSTHVAAVSNGHHLPTSAALPASLSNSSVSNSLSAENILYPQPRGYHNRWAVIICVAAYQSADVPPLQYAANDALEMEHFLVSKGFQVIMLKDERATKDSIEEMLGEYLKWKVGDDDCLLVFFAGQVQVVQTPLGEEETYLMPYDCTPARVVSKGLNIDRLAFFAKHILARHIAFIVDACASTKATFQPKEVRTQANIEGMMTSHALELLTAGSAGSSLLVLSGERPMSVFLKVLLEGLQGSAFNSSSDYVLMPELAAWLQSTVALETSNRQFPSYERIGSGEGAFVFWKNEARSVPHSLSFSLETMSSLSRGSSTAPLSSLQQASQALGGGNNQRRGSLCLETDPITITVMYSAPLVANPGPLQTHNISLEYTRLEEERQMLLDTYRETGKHIQLRVNVATIDNLRKLLQGSQQNAILHFTDYLPFLGDAYPNQMPLEDELGNMHLIDEREYVQLIKDRKQEFKLVIVTGRNAAVTANAFLQTGATHVLVSLFESPALSYVNSFFLQTFYSFLLSSEYTIRLAFDKAKAVVEEEAPTINIAKSVFLLPDHESHDVIALPGAPAGQVQLFDPAPPSNIPHKPKQVFIGRHKEMSQIVSALLSTRRVYLLGSTGVGKTKLCAAVGNFCNERRFFHDGVFYVDLENTKASAVAYSLANVFALPVNSEKELFAEFRQRQCVIMLDNCENLLTDAAFEKLLNQFQKQARHVRFLLAARPSDSYADPQPLPGEAPPAVITIGNLTPLDSTALLLQLAPEAGAFAAQISQLVDNLPLAVLIIGRWIKNGHRPEDIYHLLKAKKSENLADLHLVESSISASFSELSAEEQRYFMALSIFPGTFDKEAANQVLGIPSCKKFLRKLFADNMVDFDSLRQRYFVHALVQVFLRKKAEALPAEVTSAWALKFVEFYTNLLSRANENYNQGRDNGLRIFDSERHNIQHAMNIARSGGYPLHFCKLADAGRDIFNARFFPRERLAIYHDAVLAARQLGDKLLESSLALAYGYACERASDYPRAEEAYRAALAVREQLLGPNHHLVADALKHLGLLYSNAFYEQNQEEAGRLLQRALSIREKALGPTHPDTAMSYNHLATHLRTSTKDVGVSEVLYHKALEILQNSMMPNNGQVARVLNNLGMLYASTNREQEAENAFIKSLSIWRKSKHPDVSQTLNNLANLYKRQRKYAQAESLYRESLEIREKNGEKLAVSQNLYNLGLLMLEQQKYQQAETHLLKAVEIREQFLGRDNKLFKRALQKLIDTFNVQDKHREIEEALRRWRPSSLPQTPPPQAGSIPQTQSQPLPTGPPLALNRPASTSMAQPLNPVRRGLSTSQEDAMKQRALQALRRPSICAVPGVPLLGNAALTQSTDTAAWRTDALFEYQHDVFDDSSTDTSTGLSMLPLALTSPRNSESNLMNLIQQSAQIVSNSAPKSTPAPPPAFPFTQIPPMLSTSAWLPPDTAVGNGAPADVDPHRAPLLTSQSVQSMFRLPPSDSTMHLATASLVAGERRRTPEGGSGEFDDSRKRIRSDEALDLTAAARAAAAGTTRGRAPLPGAGRRPSADASSGAAGNTGAPRRPSTDLSTGAPRRPSSDMSQRRPSIDFNNNERRSSFENQSRTFRSEPNLLSQLPPTLLNAQPRKSFHVISPLMRVAPEPSGRRTSLANIEWIREVDRQRSLAAAAMAAATNGVHLNGAPPPPQSSVAGVPKRLSWDERQPTVIPSTPPPSNAASSSATPGGSSASSGASAMPSMDAWADMLGMGSPSHSPVVAAQQTTVSPSQLPTAPAIAGSAPPQPPTAVVSENVPTAAASLSYPPTTLPSSSSSSSSTSASASNTIASEQPSQQQQPQTGAANPTPEWLLAAANRRGISVQDQRRLSF